MLLSKRVAAAALVGFAVLAGVAVPVAAANAAGPDQRTTIAFVDKTPVKAGFGGDWSIAVHVSTAGDAVTTQDGTVDITVEGLAGDYASALPISGNGDVYVSPPDGKPALAAGTHQLTAFFRPAAGSGLATSHTSVPATVNVVALTAEATLSLRGAASTTPVVSLGFTGTWASTTKTSPPGSWTVDVTQAGTNASPIFHTTIAQTAATTHPVSVPITGDLDRGVRYDVKATFVPSSTIASGLTLTQARSTSFSTPALGLGEAVSQPITVPPFVSVLALVLLVGFVVAVSLLGARLSGRRKEARAATAREASNAEPGIAESTQTTTLPAEPIE